MLNVKKIVDFKIDNIKSFDHPDYVDAFISCATFENGKELTDSELDDLNINHKDWVQEKVIESIH
jgi:hypothetical protein